MTDNKVTAGVSTFQRVDKLENTLNSLEKVDVESVIVADNGRLTDEKKELYDNFQERMNLDVLDLEFDSGPNNCRKSIVENTETERLLLLDDDNYVPPNILNLNFFLDEVDELGSISTTLLTHGSVGAAVHRLETINNHAVKLPESNGFREVGGHHYWEFDFTPVTGLYRTEIFDDYMWDERIRLGFEHWGFFLGLKKNSDWKVGLTPDFNIIHDTGGSSNYIFYRSNNEKFLDSLEKFKEKWGVEGVANRGSFFEKNISLKTKLKWVMKRSVPVSVLSNIQERKFVRRMS